MQTSSDISIEAFLAEQAKKDQLRFITCGSVDDGKSTLLGRLLYDSKSVFSDQLSATETESKAFGTQGDAIDLALLVDGLQAEREQGITIDVAYRFFETPTRKYIAADTPGHEQYTRNMATGASTSDAAIILIDARKGVLTQTKRHSFIMSLLGIRHVILAVNKMDLVGFDNAVFNDIVEDYKQFAGQLDLPDIQAIPVSALTGDNVFERGDAMPWYRGPTLIDALDTLEVSDETTHVPFRMPIQWVNRPSPDFRGFAGMIAAGSIKTGDTIVASLSQKSSKVKEILCPSGPVDEAKSGQSVTITLADDLDISRGDLLTTADASAEVSDQFACHLIWMDEDEMMPERSYQIRFASAEASAQITDLTHSVDVNSLEKLAAKTLKLNEVGYCKIALDKAVAFDSYGDNRATGSFILMDRYTNATVGAGTVSFALRRASNIAWHEMKVDKRARAKTNKQQPCLLWFTGLSGSGKSTIADLLEQRLFEMGHRTYLLDGDNIRHGLNKDLGFTDQDRVENIRRIAEVSKLMVDAGMIVLSSFISPFRAERQMARDLMEDGEFVEIFIDTPLEICEQRDPKGLYRKARAGELKNFTGIDSEYQRPENAEICLRTADAAPEALVEQLLSQIADRLRSD